MSFGIGGRGGPKAGQFQPGESGNPAGRPKGNVRAAVRALIGETGERLWAAVWSIANSRAFAKTPRGAHVKLEASKFLAAYGLGLPMLQVDDSEPMRALILDRVTPRDVDEAREAALDGEPVRRVVFGTRYLDGVTDPASVDVQRVYDGRTAPLSMPAAIVAPAPVSPASASVSEPVPSLPASLSSEARPLGQTPATAAPTREGQLVGADTLAQQLDAVDVKPRKRTRMLSSSGELTTIEGPGLPVQVADTIYRSDAE